MKNNSPDVFVFEHVRRIFLYTSSLHVFITFCLVENFIKGYISASLCELFFEDGLHLITGIKNNMKNRLMTVKDKILLSYSFHLHIKPGS
jgi:hypothetical protein